MRLLLQHVQHEISKAFILVVKQIMSFPELVGFICRFEREIFLIKSFAEVLCECRFTYMHVKQSCSQRKYIGCRAEIQLFFLHFGWNEAFSSHVMDKSKICICTFILLNHFFIPSAHTKVDQLYVPISIKADILRLEIPMTHPIGMNKVKN